MGEKRYNAAEMSHKLREANVLLGQGQTISRMGALGITDQTYYRWRKACGGMKLDQAERAEELEAESPG
jgi:putative transposase